MDPAQPADGRQFIRRKIPVVRLPHQRIFERQIVRIRVGAEDKTGLPPHGM